MLITSAMSCSTSRMPTPRSAATRARTAPNRSVSAPSRPEDGSSSSSTSNWPARQRASSTSRRWPVDSAATGRSARSAIPASAMACPAACTAGALLFAGPGQVPPGPRPACAASRPRDTFSRTVSESNSSIFWNVRPRPCRARAAGSSADMSAPCRRSVPAAGRTSPDATLNSVVLPAPFGPISPVIRPTGAVEAHVVERDMAAVPDRDMGKVEAVRGSPAGDGGRGVGRAGDGGCRGPPLAAALAAGPREGTAAGTGGRRGDPAARRRGRGTGAAARCAA